MRTRLAIVVVVAVFLGVGGARGDVLNMTGGLTSLTTVPVGDPGNTADTTTYGAVAYIYSIGKYEVTAGQYTEFLNKVAATDTYGLYSTSMDTAVNATGCNILRSGASGSYTYTVASDWANRPVNFVSFWDSCRFANWLANGQPSGLQVAGTTERGAYTLDGYNGSDGSAIQRNTVWTWAVASENEWYKAAYYKGGGTAAGYWKYPTKSDSDPSYVGADNYTDPGNHANYTPGSLGSPYYRTYVGEFENSPSAYGTFDQGGNVFEWNEGIVSAALRDIRGGGYGSSVLVLDKVTRGFGRDPSSEDNRFGFRVVATPEPASMALLAIGGMGILMRRQGRKQSSP